MDTAAPGEGKAADAAPLEALTEPTTAAAGEAGAKSPENFYPSTLIGWIDLVAKAGAIFVVAFGVYQFLDAKSGVRITRTQDYMKDYSIGPVGDARRTIAQILRSYLPVIDKLRALPMRPAVASEAHTDLVRFFVHDSRDSKGLADELDTVIDFYERLVTCVDNSLCDQDVARAYFKEDATWLFSNFSPYIKERRVNSPTFAATAERLTTF